MERENYVLFYILNSNIFSEKCLCFYAYMLLIASSAARAPQNDDAFAGQCGKLKVGLCVVYYRIHSLLFILLKCVFNSIDESNRSARRIYKNIVISARSSSI